MSKPKTLYSPRLAETICLRIMGGEVLSKICKTPDMPTERAVHYWRLTIPEFQSMYNTAIQARTELYMEGIVDLADQATDIHSAAALRLRVDTRKWIASKLLPRQYGEKPTLQLQLQPAPSSNPAPNPETPNLILKFNPLE